MGIEYRISCTAKGLSQIAELLERLGGVASQEFPRQLEFRFQSSAPGEMPDAAVVVEPAGIYFVDYSRHEQVAVLFRQIIDEALASSDSSDRVVISGL